MGLTLDLPDDLAAALASEATRLGIALPDYAAHLLASASPRTDQVRSGGELVAYWQDEGVVGSRPGEDDSPEHARSIRERAERRDRE